MNTRSVRVDPAQSEVIAAYGVFMVSWAVLESVIQAAICKELGVSATKAVIVTGKLQFNPRVVLLRALLELHGAKHREAIKIIKNVEVWARRNTIVHGLVVTGVPGQLSFLKYDGAGSSKQTFTPGELAKHSLDLNQRTSSLQKLLEISDADVQAIGDATLEFVQVQHNEEVKASA